MCEICVENRVLDRCIQKFAAMSCTGFLGSRQLYAYIVCLELCHVYFLFLKNLNEKQIKNCFDVIKKKKKQNHLRNLLHIMICEPFKRFLLLTHK